MRTSRFALRAAGVTLGLLVILSAAGASPQSSSRGHELTVSGARFLLDGSSFPYTGVSFFNALYSPAFNESSEVRLKWLARFQSYGVNVLRVWCQWDNARGFVDFLTPHTSRQGRGKTWELAPKEIAQLLQMFRKPVVDDEPARNGTPNFGGPKDRTYPADHVLQIWEVWKVGGYATYHHDMFQTGYGSPAVPPSGIPDPEFNPYHRQVFEFLRLRSRYEAPMVSTNAR